MVWEPAFESDAAIDVARPVGAGAMVAVRVEARDMGVVVR